VLSQLSYIPACHLVGLPTPFNSGFRREMRDRGYVESRNNALMLPKSAE